MLQDDVLSSNTGNKLMTNDYEKYIKLLYSNLKQNMVLN